MLSVYYSSPGILLILGVLGAVCNVCILASQKQFFRYFTKMILCVLFCEISWVLEKKNRKVEMSNIYSKIDIIKVL